MKIKTKHLYLGLRIIVIIGWLAFFFYNLYLVRFMGQEYIADQSNFVFFDDEQHRTAYKSTLNYQASDWVDDASLISDCKPMIYFNDFYFDKINPFVILVMI
ncbi:hypothetical protein LCGC14_1637810, partial [marine sediment metagenome]